MRVGTGVVANEITFPKTVKLQQQHAGAAAQLIRC
jgi:hypothetical protein